MTERADWRVQLPLMLCMAIALVLAFLVFRFFLLTFTVAASVALLLAPLHGALTERFGGRDSLAAAVVVLLCTLLILVPVLTYGVLIGQQAQNFLEWLRPHLEPHAWERFWTETFPQRSPRLAAWLRDLGWQAPPLAESMQTVAANANRYVQVLLAGVAAALLDVVIFLMMVFFLLRDGDELREGLRGISPFTRGQETEMFEHLANTVRAVLQAMILVPLAQAVLALLGFLLFGVPSPLLWAVMVFFAALIPIVGSPLGWVPAGLYFLAIGQTGRGVGMLIYGALLISTVDNVLKPLILRGQAQIHMMLGFLSLLGGLLAFGPKGVIVGPVVLSLVLSAYRIYRYDILRWRMEERRHGTEGAAASERAPQTAGPEPVEAAPLPVSKAL